MSVGRTAASSERCAFSPLDVRDVGPRVLRWRSKPSVLMCGLVWELTLESDTESF